MRSLQVVEQLLDLQYQRTKAIDEDFNSKLKALNDEFAAEKGEVATAHAKHRKDMNDIILAMQSQFTELEADLRQVRCPHLELQQAAQVETEMQLVTHVYTVLPVM